ncbi:Rpn family recombination-promoting nuclease/putative transposase [Xylocopilactobacillus apis]|uniref:Rpn family recombination-promoting nuclease/putative transposase n=1 Tax=Xylocopilactobacillus apis TaxID=2932183 RepID=A0AAU9CT86_9LACO|nr:Rpn family recombination-promoting nuclease/putative transposase [Xylocopilactobacillus apis]BDR55566.1 hypothetical protein KIMC2_01280 [Xylocopilactobacillus apis]BDR57227.1 hypothetical protein KIMC2_17890 [Xylocopilactobacillus apis]
MRKREILPSNDLLFKKLFASPKNRHILIGFIHDMIGLNVVDVIIENPYNIRTFKVTEDQQEFLETEVDVLARLDDGSLVTIELQVRREAHFIERSLHYLSEKYVSNYARRDLEKLKDDIKEDKYGSLRPVYGINIVYFDLFKEDNKAYHRFTMYDVKNKIELKNEDGLPLLSVVYFDLTKPRDTLEGEMPYWYDYLKSNKKVKEAPEYLQDAYKVTSYENLEMEEREMLDAVERARSKLDAQMLYAEEEGRKRGEEQGVKQTKIDTAKKMLKMGMKVEEIHAVTDLSVEEIEKLK